MPAGGRDWTQKPYLTTRDVAALLEVSLPTVVNWIEAGKLSAHRTPGGHRRISRAALVQFSTTHSYPLPAAFHGRAPSRVLVIDADPDLGEMMRDYLVARGGFSVQLADGPLEAGYLLASFAPEVVILDINMPGLDARGTLAFIRERLPPAQQPRVLACAVTRGIRVAALLQEFDGQIPKPIPWEQLLPLVRQAMNPPA